MHPVPAKLSRFLGGTVALLGLSAFALSPISASAAGGTYTVSPSTAVSGVSTTYTISITDTLGCHVYSVALIDPSGANIGVSTSPAVVGSMTSGQTQTVTYTAAYTASADWGVYLGSSCGPNWDNVSPDTLTITAPAPTPTPVIGGGGGGGGYAGLSDGVSAINVNHSTMAWINLAYLVPIILSGLIIGFSLLFLRHAVTAIREGKGRV